MKQQFESKSILAKLMATENLTIEQRNVQTASFNVKDRVLTIPVLDKNISAEMYDLFMGHEVGHALYTPLEGIKQAFEEKINISVCNVVEDARIERKIKSKYPGLRLSFVKAYRELIEKNFFGTVGIDLNDMCFIDRINMYFKGGPSLGIKFSSDELVVIADIEKTESFEDVLLVTKRILEIMEEQMEEQKEQQKQFVDSDFDGDDFENEDEDEDDFENENEDEDVSESESEYEKDEQKLDENTKNSNRNNSSDKHNIRSMTDDNYRMNESKLFSEDNKHYIYVNVPKFDTEEAAIDYKSIWNLHRNTNLHNPQAESLFQKLLKDNNRVVSYLVKEFELRKNADQLKRSGTAKTGDLNMSNIYSYKFNDDIFKKITVLPGGKSHGLVMFLDWSGSMCDHIENTVKQLLSLVMFCKKVNIPYEVFSFIKDSTLLGNYSQEPKLDDMTFGGFRLMNILSSRMSAGDFKYAATALVGISNNVNQYCPYWMCLNSTPMNQAIIFAMDYIPLFQSKYKLQVVNTIFLTDGDSDICRGVYHNKYNASSGKDEIISSNFYSYSCAITKDYKANPNVVITDPVTKNQIHNDTNRNFNVGLTSSLIKLMKLRTRCHVLGFYVISNRIFNRNIGDFFPMTLNSDKIKSEFRKKKHAILTNFGWDEYYLLSSDGLNTDDVEFDSKGKTTTRGLVTAFSKYNGNRHNNRIVLNRFISMIS